MGKPYQRELEALTETYDWAMKLPLSELTTATRNLQSHPLLVIGSGGSLAAATFASTVHEACTCQLSRAATPLDACTLVSARGLSLLFLSAGGRNADIRGAFTALMRLEPSATTVMCFSPGSALSRQARQYSFTELIERDLPSGKDGFLSVNSLFGFAVLILRAYTKDRTLPSSYIELESGKVDGISPLHQLRDRLAPLWGKNYLLLIHGSDLRAAAVDMESKFSEAALGAVQVADLRNFAHGRHHWLAKHGDDTGVIFLVSEREARTAKRTSRLLPNTITQATVEVPGHGLIASLRALLWVFHFAGFAGQSVGIDPGRPGVPEFGSKVYSLNVWQAHEPSGTDLKRVAVDRKLAASGLSTCSDLRPHWEEGFDRFTERIERSRFQAFVSDFDGTLVNLRERVEGIKPEVAARLNDLLRGGIPIGIATGRGSSVRSALQSVISPKFHEMVYIGYHNCSEIGALSLEPQEPSDNPEGPLRSARELLESSELISDLCTMHPSGNQVGLRARDGVGVDVIYKIAQDVLSTLMPEQIQCLMSTHSVDIVPVSTSKTKLTQHLLRLGFKSQLVIGDMGQWPGNDYAFLEQPISLSSAQVSSSISNCWNLAPAGYVNVTATTHYLNAIRIKGATFQLVGLKEGVLRAN
jgi:hypothetical protein